jgi:phosphoenolpyruvate---glycerone phosphotransferase subunit DhaL
MINQKEILLNAINAISRRLISAENELTDLDSMGDADCGSGIRRGFEAVLEVAGELAVLEIGDILKKTGFTLAYTIGGTSGAMLGTGFIETGKSIGDNKDPRILDWIIALERALDAIKKRGGNTKIGDKTLVDSFEPAVAAMRSVYEYFYATGRLYNSSVPNPSISGDEDSGEEDDLIGPVMRAGYMGAMSGSDKTIEMIAKKGRASYVGERSRGSRDPGSLIIALMFEAALNVFEGIKKG